MTDEKETFRELMQRWKEFQGMTNHQERGIRFEGWLKDLFQAAGLQATGSFERKDPDAELDGAIHLDSNTYLLEAKWVQGPINADPFTKLKARVDMSTAATYGLLISVSGFNSNAVSLAEKLTPLRLFFVDTPHLEALLNRKIDGKMWLRSLLNIAGRNAKVYIPIEENLAERQVNAPDEAVIREKLIKIAALYREKIRQHLENRKYRDWYRYRDNLIPCSLEIVAWDENRLGLQRTGDMSGLFEALKLRPYWLILGEAGSGKSTLLEKFLLDTGNSFPILIKTTNNSNEPVEAIRIALSEFQLSLTVEEINAGIKSQLFSILIDGLEERDEGQKKQIFKLCDAALLLNIPVLAAVRETVFLSFKGSLNFPDYFGMLRLCAINSYKTRCYLDSRLGLEKAQQAYNAVTEKEMVEVIRTPLILDTWLKYALDREFPISNSKMEILEHFFNYLFEIWDIPKVPGSQPVFVKERLLIGLAQFLFEKKNYKIQRRYFEEFFYREWERLLEQRPGVAHLDSPLEALIHHGLISTEGQYIGFALPLYRDYFLIRGLGESTFSCYDKQQLAQICFELHFDSKAMELYRSAAFDPAASDSVKVAASLFFKNQGELSKAAEIIQTALPSRNPVLYQIYALILKDSGRYKEAEVQFKKGIAADAKDAPSYQAYGLMLKDMGRLEEAEGQFKKGIAADAKHAPLFQAYAIMLKDMGRLEEAEDAFRRAVKFNPDVRCKITLLNYLFYCRDHIDEAESMVNFLLKNKIIKGIKRKQLNLTLKLIQWRKEYLDEKPGALENHANLYQYARELLYQDNYVAAEIALKQLYDLQPNDFSTCHRLGRLLIRQGNNDGIKYIEKAMELNPDPDRETLYKILFSAIKAAHYDWTQKQLNLFLPKEPENSQLLLLQAKLLAKLGRVEEAQSIFIKAYELAQSGAVQATILRERARILLDRDNPGNRTPAEILLEKAWVMEPGDIGAFKMTQELYAGVNRPPGLKNIYRSIRQRLEPGDMIDVKLYRFIENREVQCYYYGVPCILPWRGAAGKNKVGAIIPAIFRGLNEKDQLNLDWSKTQCPPV